MSTEQNTTNPLSEELANLTELVRASVVQVHEGSRGIGSGIIWRLEAPDADGEADATIITNAHVVRAAGEKTLTLQLADNRKIQGTLIAVDPAHDLAALRVHTSSLHPAQIGDSTKLRVGELMLAVGHPLGRIGALTFGVLAARAPADPDIRLEPIEPARDAEKHPASDGDTPPGRERRLQGVDFIQADIRLYPGNSGGPLADAQGRVVGVNAMVGGGLAFAIPSRVVEQFLLEVGQATSQVYLGVQVLTAPLPAALRQRLGIQQETAALVLEVEAGSPAEAAGIIVGDVVLAVQGQAVHDVQYISRLLRRARPSSGQGLTLSLLRGGERLELSLLPEVRAAA
ncbi:MAG TPA: trypsin-like peptidase domain-containing protein [Ktedonobacterales bacterium]|jgi:serine protease Do